MKLLLLVPAIAIIIVLGLNRNVIIARLTTPPSCPANNSATKGIEFRTGLEGNYRENLSLLIAASRRTYDSDPHAQDAITALDDNAWDLGYFLQNLYGPDVGQKFTALWQQQNRAFLNYTTALKNGDPAAKTAAKTEIQTYLDDKTTFWKELLPHLDTARYRRMVTSRSDSMISAIDAYAAGNAAKSYKEQHSAYQQTGQVANMLSDIIIQQMPEKFLK